MRLSVIGAGSWGTTLAHLFCSNGHSVHLWAREPEVAEGIRERHRNPFFVSGLELSPDIFVTCDLDECLKKTDGVVFAVPSNHLRRMACELASRVSSGTGILNAAKGLEPESGKRLSEVLLEVFGVAANSAADRIAVLSGPNLATEIASGKIGATVVASPNEDWNQTLQEALASRTFRVYRHSDRIGVELGGTLKNVFAIGAGIVDGLNLGDNAKAAYLTRCLHEMVRLGARLGGKPATFYGLSGLGDLMATAMSPLSRNHQMGLALARNRREEFQNESARMVVEGVETARMAREWGKKLTIPLPITEEIYSVLFENKSPREAAKDLMTRSLKDEES
ncbi:MAG: NAD(P)-dependent glycerol-3-phosphate dehydrogenase [Candidatus Riflebacteria bacterium]|nr:NAD(P)-dependent glycerol-3-phosphate dehydrogenase [Candidatus Riflebacteria bacterium]